MKRMIPVFLFSALVFAQPWEKQAANLTGSTAAFLGGTHSWADVDGDGDYDLFVGDSRLWINDLNNSGTFINRSNQIPNMPVDPWSVAFGDFNNDGKPDAHIARGFGGPNALLQNNWPDPFTEVSGELGYFDSEFCQPAFWVDYNNDGLLDFYVTHEFPGDAHEFWQNDYPNNFIPRFPSNGNPDNFGLADLNSHAYGNSWADIDLDGDIDTITSACGTGAGGVPGEQPHNKLYENKTIDTGGSPGDRFVDRTLDLGLVDQTEITEGSEDYWALFFDYDGDEYLDLFIGDNDDHHRLWRNTSGPGGMGFTLVPESTHNLAGGRAYGHSAVAGDVDNDGDQDIYMTLSGLQINNGDGSFTQSNWVPATSTFFKDCSFVDYNNDGFLDILNQDDLFLNPGNNNNWIAIDLEGLPDMGTARTAHHVKIRVTAGSKVMHRQHRSQTGSYSQHLLPTHFGLGQESLVDEVQVTWPNGDIETFTNIPVNQTITLFQDADCTGELSTVQTTNLTYCLGDSIPLAGQSNNAIDVRWRVKQGPNLSNTQFSNFNALDTEFTPIMHGNYVLELNYRGCSNGGIEFHINDSDFDENGSYGLGDIQAMLDSWNITIDRSSIFDLDNDGFHTIQDILTACALN